MIYLSGSFTVLHDGHRALIGRALELAELHGTPICIGIMSDGHIAGKYPGIQLPNEAQRMEAVKEYVKNYNDTLICNFFIQRDPRYMPDFKFSDILVVSRETVGSALALLKGADTYPLLSIVPMVCDDNGKEIHSKQFILKG